MHIIQFGIPSRSTIVLIYACACSQMTWHRHREQSTTSGCQFSPSILGVPGILLRSAGLVVNAFTNGTILPQSSISLSLSLSFFPSFLPSFHMSTCLSGKVNLKSGKTLMSYSWSGNFKWCLLTIIFIQYLLTISIWSYNVYCNKEYEKHGFACMDRYGVNTRDALLQNPNSLYHEATT